MIKQYLAPDGYVVSLQNCLNEERIAGKLLQVLVDEGEAAHGLPGHECRQRLDVLPLAPGRTSHEVARAGDGVLRRRAVALHEREERTARMGQRESLIRGYRLGEAPLPVEAIGEQVVHAVLVPLDGDGGRGRDGQTIAVSKSHA